MKRLIFLLALCALAFSQSNIRLEIAKKYQSQKQYDKALKELRAYSLENPKDPQALVFMADIYTAQKEYSQAQNYYQKVLVIDAANANALKGLAFSLFKKGSLEQSLLFYRKWALSSKKASLQAQPQIDKIVAMLRGDKPKSSNLAMSTDKRYSTDLFQKGMVLQNAGKDKAALQMWRKVLAADPGNPGAYYFAGVNRYNLNALKKAEYNFKKSFAFPEKGFNAYYYLGRIAEKRKQNTQAIQNYQKYLKKTKSTKGKKEVEKRIARLKNGSTEPMVKSKTPDESKVEKKQESSKFHTEVLADGSRFVWQEGKGEAILKKAWKKLKHQKTNEAINFLKEVNLEYPTSENARNSQLNLLMLYTRLGLDKSAINLSKLMLRLDPPDPFKSAILYYKTLAVLNTGKPAEAKKSIKEIVPNTSAGPLKQDVIELKAKILKLTQEPDAARSQMEKAILNEKDSKRKRALQLELARELVEQNKTVEAEKKFTEILESCKGNDVLCRKAAYGRADIQFKKKAWTKALENYESAVKTYPDSTDAPWGEYQVANILRVQKKYRLAMEKYNDVVENFPRSYWAEQAMWKRDDTIWREEYEGVLE